MAKSWLELENNLRSGAATLPISTPDLGCGVSFSTETPDDILNLPDPTEATSAINQFLADTQATIDEIGADVMQVLQDIGAFIPPGLFNQSTGTGESQTPQATFADINNYSTETSAGGNLAQTTGYNDQTGDSFWQLKTSSGSGMTLDTDGSFYITTAKNPSDDPNTGKFGVTSAGPTIFKLNEFLAIEINNDNEVLSAENPSVPGCAFSIIVNGPTDILVRNGDLKVKGTENVLIEAGKSLELKGSDIKIHAGSGTGESTNEDEPPTDEQGGTVEIKAAMFKNSSVSQQNVEGATFNKVTGEKTFVMDDPQAVFSIVSAGSLELRCGGDMVEDVGGRKLTRLLTAKPTDTPPVPLITNQAAAYYITNAGTITPVLGSANQDNPPPLLEVNSPTQFGGGGFAVNTVSGNILFSSTTGNFGLATGKDIMTAINVPYKSVDVPSVLKGLKSGMFFGSGTQSMKVYSGSDVGLGLSATPPNTKIPNKAVSVGTKKTEVVDSGGIYLN